MKRVPSVVGVFLVYTGAWPQDPLPRTLCNCWNRARIAASCSTFRCNFAFSCRRYPLSSRKLSNGAIGATGSANVGREVDDAEAALADAGRRVRVVPRPIVFSSALSIDGGGRMSVHLTTNDVSVLLFSDAEEPCFAEENGVSGSKRSSSP